MTTLNFEQMESISGERNAYLDGGCGAVIGLLAIAPYLTLTPAAGQALAVAGAACGVYFAYQG